jgi:hypothetical protein
VPVGSIPAGIAVNPAKQRFMWRTTETTMSRLLTQTQIVLWPQ